MDWQHLKMLIIKELQDRNLANPYIRINALERISDMFKKHYPDYYNEPTLLLSVAKADLIKDLSKYKKLNSAESSIINTIFETLKNYGNAKTVNKCEKASLPDIKVKSKKIKGIPQIVDSADKMTHPQDGLKPLVNKETVLMILGTFPAKESIDAGFYYQNQIKRFWVQALSAVGDFDNLSNKNREQLLLQKGIGLWDVFECVERDGSNQDKAIIKGKYNDFANFLSEYSSIKYIVFNGISTSKWLQPEHHILFKEKYLELKELQSTSGSNASFNYGESWTNYFNELSFIHNNK